MIKQIVTLTLLAVCSVAVIGCQDSEPAPLTSEDIDAIRTMSSEWMSAAAEGNWDDVVATYTDDAVLWFNGNPIEGKEAIRDFFEQMPPMTGMDLIIDDVYGRGDLAVISGHSTQLIDGEVVTSGRYLDTRLRQPDGSWLFHRDMVTHFLAPPFVNDASE